MSALSECICFCPCYVFPSVTFSSVVFGWDKITHGYIDGFLTQVDPSLPLVDVHTHAADMKYTLFSGNGLHEKQTGCQWTLILIFCVNVHMGLDPPPLRVDVINGWPHSFLLDRLLVSSVPRATVRTLKPKKPKNLFLNLGFCQLWSISCSLLWGSVYIRPFQNV